jgi:hypothetical protein
MNTKLKACIAAAALIATTGIAGAQTNAYWVPTGIYSPLGPVLIDLVNYEERKALRGFWVKIEHHNGNALLINYSMSCYARTSVTVASVVYDRFGRVVRADLEQGEQYRVTSDFQTDLMNFVCEGYVPPRAKPRTNIRNVPGRF